MLRKEVTVITDDAILGKVVSGCHFNSS